MRKLKRRGIVPAIIYGGKDKPQPLQVSRRDISVMLSHASGENILVELEIAGEKSSRMALIQEVQHSPWAAMFCTSISMPFRWTKKSRPMFRSSRRV